MTKHAKQKAKVTNLRDLSLSEVIKYAAPQNLDDFPKTTRAVSRLISPGNDFDCNVCGEPLKFAARERRTQVIANVYNQMGEWAVMKTMHPDCYEDLGSPFGPATFGGISPELSQALGKHTQSPIVK